MRMEAESERRYFAGSEDGARGLQAEGGLQKQERARKHPSAEPPERKTALPTP